MNGASHRIQGDRKSRTPKKKTRIPKIRAVLQTIESARAEMLAVLLAMAEKKTAKKKKKRIGTRRFVKGNA